MNTKLVVILGILIVLGGSYVIYNSLNASRVPDVSMVPGLLPDTLPEAQRLLETLSLLPERLAGEPRQIGDVQSGLLNYTVVRYYGHRAGRGDAYNTSILAQYQGAAYNGIQLHIFLTFGTALDLEGEPYNYTAYEGEALLHLLFTHPDWYRETLSHYNESQAHHSWYLATTVDHHIYAWDAHTWVFSIEAADQATLFQATEDVIRHLRTLN